MTRQALVARLEGAEAGSRELDEEIHDLLCDRRYRTCIAGLTDEQGGLWMYEFEGHATGSALRVTTSLDAALSLAERLFPDQEWMVIVNPNHGEGGFTYAGLEAERSKINVAKAGRLPALTLCIAILKADNAKGEPR